MGRGALKKGAELGTPVKHRVFETKTPGWGARVRWWAFLGLVWTPALAFVAAPMAAIFVPALRTAWLLVPWLGGLALAIRWLLVNLRVGRRPARPRPVAPSATPRRVAVIGAGPCGLTTVKELRAVGVDVTCFESGPGVGGVYRVDFEREGGAWPGTRLTSSPWVTAFSDFPPDSPSSRHWRTDEYVDYLERYVDAFDLRSSIRTKHRVQRLERVDGERWRLEVHDVQNDRVSSHVFDHVAVCSGLHLNPRQPTIDGAERFSGTIQHAARYRGPEPYADKRVVVVGLGESAADIAHEIASVADHVTLSVRRGKFVIPRINPRNGIANDYDTNRLRYAAPAAVRNLYMRLRRLACLATPGEMDARARLRLELLLESGAGPMSQPATKSDEFLDDLLEGRAELRPPIDRLDGDTVCFEDGTEERADAVLLATGYRPSFPFLDWGDEEPRHPGEMYLNMFVPGFGASLAFMGFARPAIGSIPPSGELQARAFAQLVIGGVELPSERAMIEDIAETQLERLRAFPGLELPHVIVSWIPFMDRVAELAGVRPSTRTVLTNPRLAWQIMSGPMTGAMYRLEGPGARPELARRTILSLPRKHDLDELLTLCLLHFYADVASWFVRDGRLDTETSFV